MYYGKKATRRRQEELEATGVKLRKKFGVLLGKAVLVCIFLGAVLGISAGIGVWKGIIDSAPDISAIDVTPTGYSTTVLANNGEQIATLVASGANRKYVTIQEIPEDLQHAFVAIEDERFYEHNGIDPKGILRALLKDIATRSTKQGASTITQQLIKNSVLVKKWESEGESTIEKVQRKIQEQYLAVELERQVKSKDWILENYLNTINLGSNTLGVQAASERYFGKDVSELTLSECAVIAGITKNPYGYNPIRFPEENRKRQETVLLNMKKQGYITQEEYDAALADNVYDRIAEYNLETGVSYNTYFVDALIEDVKSDLMEILGYSETEAYKALYQGGLTIVSTQDLAMQDICDEEVNNIENYPLDEQYSAQFSFQVKKADGTYQTYTNTTMASYYKSVTKNDDFEINYTTKEEVYEAIAQYKQDVLETGDELVADSEAINITIQPEVALTLMDQHTGEVKAMVGGRGEKVGNRTWNRATDTLRQPGSTFKIIGAYAAALDAGGLTLASVQDDAPLTVGSKTYNNYDKKYRGFTNLRMAITNSMNIVTVKTLQQIGVQLGYDYAQKFGFTTLVESDKNLGLCLGGLTHGVSNLELTAAYASIANSGEYLEPKFYSIVYDHDGNVLLEKAVTQERHEVVSEETAWLLTNAMEDVMTSGTGTRAYFHSDNAIAQAGKSGTTTSNRDCLWAGYTPYYTCVVWGGFDDNSKQRGDRTSYPKNIWKAIMGRIHEDLDSMQFEKPSGIVTASVCRKSGKLPIEDVCTEDPRGSMEYTEFFAKGTEPEEECDHHIALEICKDSKKIATDFCPLDGIKTVVYIVGAEEGSEDEEYLATENFLSKYCKKHKEEAEEETPEDPLDLNGDGIPDDIITGDDGIVQGDGTPDNGMGDIIDGGTNPIVP